MVDDEDPASEAERFSALLMVLLDIVPEIGQWWTDTYDEEAPPMTLGAVGLEAVLNLFDTNDQPQLVDTVWPRMLQVVELAVRVADILDADETREDDATTVGGFATAGILCDATRKTASIQILLPWLGPHSVEAAQDEMEAHSLSRGFGVDDVDWSNAGSRFIGLAIRPEDLLPTLRG